MSEWSYVPVFVRIVVYCVFFFQAEDGIRDLVRSRGLGDVYKRQCVQPQVHVHSATTSTVMMRVHGLAHTFTLQGGTVHVPATHASMLSAT